MVKEAQNLARKEEKKKKMEAQRMAKEVGDDDSVGSSGIASEKSGSKKTGKTPMDLKSAQSPHTQSEKYDKLGSEKQSLGKGHLSQGESGTDKEDDDGDGEGDGQDKEESMDEIADLPSQNEMKRELIIAIEEELREQDELKRQNEELQR